MTQKNKVLFAVIMIPISIFICYWQLTSLTSSRDTRDVSDKISAARKAIEQMPPGMGRADEFVRRLKAIDPGYAPAKVKQALKEYTDAMERSTEAAKNNQNIEPLERVCAEKAQALRDALNAGR